MKNIKKILLFALLCTLSICLFVSGETLKVKADTTYDFANINEEQSLEFLEDHNIEIPAIFSGNREEIGCFAKDIIKKVYKNPTHEFVINYDKTLNFANEIKQAVLPYLNEQNVSPQSCSPYYLQYNTVKNSNGEWVTRGGAWDNRWTKYNCYAFSIGRNELVPFYNSPIFQYQPGDMSGMGSFDRKGSIEKLANLIKNDLEAMGYDNVLLRTAIPGVTKDQALICVRKCNYDYHFMKYDLTTNAWYHKPADTAILKYNGIPNNSEIWYGETSKYGIEGYETYDYDSDIYFIRYDRNIFNVSINDYPTTQNINANADKDTLLEIKNNVDNKYYTFDISAPSAFKTEFYNDEMELCNAYTGTHVVFSKPLSTKKQFLKFNFINANVSGNITLTISAHNHQYTYTASDSGHLESCGCGYTENQPHTYVNPEKKDGTQHIVHCVCGASKAEDHTYSESYVWLDGYSHRAYCECGAATKRGHAVASGAKPPYTCIFCNGSAQVGITEYSLSIPIGATQITENGSYVLPNGITIVAEADLEDFLNGTPKLLKHNLVLSA